MAIVVGSSEVGNILDTCDLPSDNIFLKIISKYWVRHRTLYSSGRWVIHGRFTLQGNPTYAWWVVW